MKTIITLKLIQMPEGIEQTITNGTINSYVAVTDGLSVPSKEGRNSIW